MESYPLLILAIFSSTCWATNDSFNGTSANHATSSSSTRGNIGDYVAAGLGITTHQTPTATLAIGTRVDENTGAVLGALTEETLSIYGTTISDTQTQTNNSASRSPIHPNKTESLTTASPVSGASGHFSTTTNITNATSATDCWHSWLDYWSASSFNKETYVTSLYNPSTRTNTEMEEANTLIPTSSWQSDVYTFTDSILVTFFSDGYPVSVSVSYDFSTRSNVGWTIATIWSSLSDFETTFTETLSFYDQITTTKLTSALPTPRCKLQAVVPECSLQWSSWIHGDGWKYYDDFDTSTPGYFAGTPDCTQAKITGDLCTSMASFYFAHETMYGQGSDVGWVSANSTSYFPASKSLAPGCSLGCQACSITGESVQLYYWPPSTATLVENGTETATLTPFTRNGTSLRTFSVDGE